MQADGARAPARRSENHDADWPLQQNRTIHPDANHAHARQCEDRRSAKRYCWKIPNSRHQGRVQQGSSRVLSLPGSIANRQAIQNSIADSRTYRTTVFRPDFSCAYREGTQPNEQAIGYQCGVMTARRPFRPSALRKSNCSSAAIGWVHSDCQNRAKSHSFR